MRTLPWFLTLALGLATAGCHVTTHPSLPSPVGIARPSSVLEAIVDKPGPVAVETVVGADWAVDRSGLINLDHPKAIAQHLQNGPEPLVVVFHAIRHPLRGLFLVDTGVEQALLDDPSKAAVSGIVARMSHMDQMRVRTATKAWLDRQPEPPRGVFLTHLHLDHLTGMRDVPKTTPIFMGNGEASERSFLNLFVVSTTDDTLDGKAAVFEWPAAPDRDGAFDGVVDVFGDMAVWALAVPGHTPGSTAYLARTTTGPVLMVGDTCPTVWGWQNGVEPGYFSSDGPRNAKSLARLKAFVDRHPGIDVRLGHQFLPAKR